MIKILFGAIAALISVILLMPISIKLLKRLKFGQNILHYVEAHATKQGTPTMGGIVFVFVISVVFTIFSINQNSSLGYMCVATFVAFSLLGFLDDFLKIRHKDNLGLKAYQKAFGQLLLAIVFTVYSYLNPFIGTELVLPFVMKTINVGWWIIPITIFVFLASTNAVNLTDGLDGLASAVTIAFLIAIFTILHIEIQVLTNAGTALNYLTELKNLQLLTAISIGGVLGFFVFNANKASIFMGDVGSLALGALLSAICIFSKLTLFIPIFGLMFVCSVVSVIIQVLYFKKTKKRVFLMAPLHHHFEKKGVNENKIVVIYFVITAAVSALTVAITLCVI